MIDPEEMDPLDGASHEELRERVLELEDERRTLRARVEELEGIERAALAWRMHFRDAQVRGHSSAMARVEALRQFEAILSGLGPDGRKA